MKTLYLRPLFLALGLLLFKFSFGQLSDTVKLKQVTIISFFHERPILRMPSAMSVIDTLQLRKQQGVSLGPVINTVPGVRMEERSPGSYRLSIRGSLLRSPFGVRNVKIYLDEFPLTDAGGNTYLNLLDVNVLGRIVILKGPDGSLYGANSGGVVHLNTDKVIPNEIRAKSNFMLGSYGLHYQNLFVQVPHSDNLFGINVSLQSSAGYRENSALQRKYVQLTDRWDYNKSSSLKVFVFYSNLFYETPGGITLEQWDFNPRSARQPTAIFPGAVEQKAGVENQTLFGGLNHDFKINSFLNHSLALFGSQTAFENSFITNYEVRNEKSMGFRTYIEASNSKEGTIHLTMNLGAEFQHSKTNVSNYGNSYGIKDTIQAADRLKAINGFIFARASIDFYNKFILETSASINDHRYLYASINPIPTPEDKRLFNPQIMPRFVVSYLLLPSIAWRASMSKGYSPPTFNEIRSSDNIINTTLDPEIGWNYESGFRLQRVERFWWDVSFFNYRMEQAIVRRLNEAGEEYFINSGKINQSGIESQISVHVLQGISALLRNIQITHAFTFHDFKFLHYLNDTSNYSGNKLTGVPQYQSVAGLAMDLGDKISTFIQYTFTSRIPLNDANTVFASSTHLLFAKFEANIMQRSNLNIKAHCGIDNILNARYSLGNDINALGGRYYNPASARNYFMGLRLEF